MGVLGPRTMAMLLRDGSRAQVFSPFPAAWLAEFY
jgi:hypothetical protein